MKLSAIQKDILDTEGNIVVSASAGTGKTYILVEKIKKDIEENQSHKVIAAITFTIKAAKEIRNRISIDTKNQFIGTNNSFVLEEIIRPFLKDVYGAKYNFDIGTDYSYEKHTFKDCMEFLESNQKICSYEDKNKNFIFELALKIIKKSEACRLFLKAKFFKIYIDEYQDCDEAMHNFFMYLYKELGIYLFIVGDEKQCIYMWRGANCKLFSSIFKLKDFSHKSLRENYRSCQQIQNYSNLLNESTRALYKPLEDKNSIIYINSTDNTWVSDIKKYLDMDKTCALLRFSNKDSKSCADWLNQEGLDFVFIPRMPISDISTEVSWLYLIVAKYFIISRYSVYDFIDEISYSDIKDNGFLRYFKERLDLINNALNSSSNYHLIKLEMEKMADYLNWIVEVKDEDVKKMVNTIVDSTYHPAFCVEEYKHIVMTFHSSKGMEFEQVVIFANDYDLNTIEHIYNHYVAVTRAKSKLIIINLNSSARQYCRNLTQLFRKNGVKPKDVMTIVSH